MQTVRGKEVATPYYPYPYHTTGSADEDPTIADENKQIPAQTTCSKEDLSPGR